MKIINVSTIVDVVTFLSATVLIWAIESVRTVPLHLSLSTLDFIDNVLPIQASPGFAMGITIIVGIIYTSILAAIVVVAFRKTRRNLT